MADSKPSPNENPAADGVTEELVAYLDGELDARGSEAMAARLSLDPKLRSQADSLQRAWDILDILPRPQPSSTFANRTVSQLLSVPATGSGMQTAGFPSNSNPALTGFPTASSSTGFWLISFVLMLAAGLSGYFAHQVFAPQPKSANLDPPLEDVPLMKNMRLYRHVDDMEYLQRLDTPELFGDPSES